MVELSIDCPATRKSLVSFIRNGIRQAGFTKGVVGLSGGVDSALAATLAAEALGPENLLTIFMPSHVSDPLSREHAVLVAGTIGARLIEIEITPQVAPYFDLFPDADQLRRGNKMARERMSILFDQSAAHGGLVVGTSNRTEILLGYGTLYGDTACSLNPLAGLLKTQVFQLARSVGITDAIVTKPPTADLWKGQTDEEELGFSYSDVDRLIFLMLDKGLADRELESNGFDRQFVDTVRDMMKRFTFKSRLPLMAGPPVME